jgi:protein O-mannosyl-transferase
MNPPRSLAIPVLLFCATILAAYLGSLSNGFAGDARGLVIADERVHYASAENIDRIFTHTYWWPYGESGLYRPATTLSYLFNYAILGSGKNAAGYHWTNLLLHLLNAVLLYFVARRFTGAIPAAWIAALWGVHPVLTESVAAISGRPDLIAGVCVLGGLLLYWKSIEAAGARRIAWLAALALVTLIGVLAKESAIVLPAIVLLYALLWRDHRGLLGAGIAMFIPIQVMFYLRAASMFGLPPTQFPFWDNPITGAGFWTGRAAALAVIGREVALLIWPAKLSSDYSWSQIRPEEIAWLGVPVAILGAAGVALLWRWSRTGFFVAIAALLAWLPSSNLLFPIGTIMAERFLYLPATAFAAGLVWLAMRLPQRVAWGVLGAVAIALAVRTWDRNRAWGSDLTLGEAAVQSTPDSYKSHKLLANALFEAEGPTPRVLTEAEKSLAILAPLSPVRNNADTWRRAASWYLGKGDPASLERALELLARTREIASAQGDDSSAIAEIDRMCGEVHLRMGDTRAGLEATARAAHADPSNPEAWRQYSDALGSAGRVDDAVVALMEGVLLTTDNGLRQRMVELYRRGAGGSCALLPGQNGAPAINPACPEVKKHLCAADALAITLRLRSGRVDLADGLRNSGMHDFGCDADTLAAK